MPRARQRARVDRRHASGGVEGADLVSHHHSEEARRCAITQEALHHYAHGFVRCVGWDSVDDGTGGGNCMCVLSKSHSWEISRETKEERQRNEIRKGRRQKRDGRRETVEQRQRNRDGDREKSTRDQTYRNECLVSSPNLWASLG